MKIAIISCVYHVMIISVVKATLYGRHVHNVLICQVTEPIIWSDILISDIIIKR